MVEQITKFRASDKTDHECAFAAWKHELKIWLIANGADNEAIASKIVKAVDDGRLETLAVLATIVTGMTKTAPETEETE
jgi:hypothetical protein